MISVAPNQQFVVVTPRRQLLLVWTPLEAAHFLLVPLQSPEVVPRGSQITVEDALISRPTAHKGRGPGSTPDSSLMASKTSHNFLLALVPALKLPLIRTNCQVVSILRPIDAGDKIMRTQVVELSDFTSCGRP
jgi:hypothetical protein